MNTTAGEFEDAIVVVNAAAGAGIGSEVVRGFLREGATCIATDASEKRLQRLHDELHDDVGDRIRVRALDASGERAVTDLFAEIDATLGRVDVLVNNVGMNRLSPIPETSLETWMSVLNTSLTSHFLHIRSAWPLLSRASSPAVVNISSLAARKPTTFGEAAYAAAKAGVIGLTRAAAVEGAAEGIRVNAVLPGLIFNPSLDRAVAREYIEAYRTNNPLGRDGTPAEVADLVLYLASSRSSYVTGEVIRVA